MEGMGNNTKIRVGKVAVIDREREREREKEIRTGNIDDIVDHSGSKDSPWRLH